MKSNSRIQVIVCLSYSSLAQNKYIKEGSIGKKIEQPDTTKIDCFTFRPIEKWVGEKFIFISRRNGLSALPFNKFKDEKGEYKQPVIEEVLGRICTITSVVKDKLGIYEYVVIKMDDNGQIYALEIDTDECITNLAPIADIDSARARWLNRTLWYTKRVIWTYDAEKDSFIGSIRVKKYSPVKVIDIVAGWDKCIPVRFVIRTNKNEEGFVYINLSGTNTPWSRKDYRRFGENFLQKDPRNVYKWDKHVWDAIEEEKVFIGMTSKQAEMSWGKPESINKTIVSSRVHEQWVYHSGSYLYFENGILTSIQN